MRKGMANRFRSPNSTPPTGCYEYECGGRYITSPSRSAISRMALDLRASQGLPSVGTGIEYVMEYMCPRLPDGFCTRPSSIPYLKVEDVKAATAALFPLPLATTDVISERLRICVRCQDHVTRGFCMGCSGFQEWIYKGFSGRRARLSEDAGAGICPHDRAFVAAVASVSAMPAEAGIRPAGCWRCPGGTSKCLQTT